MLERAPICLESGGRQLLRRPKPCLRTRRMLHASFWHQSASSLDLSPCWIAPSQCNAALGDNDGASAASHDPKAYEGLLLDFLYPKETLSLIRRMSKTGLELVEGRHRYRTVAGGLRHFSTSNWVTTRASSTLRRPLEPQVQQNLGEEESSSSSLDDLKQLLSSRPPGKEELAWRLFESLTESDCTPKLRREVLQYLAAPKLHSDPSRLLRIFEGIPLEERNSSCYEAAISAYLALEMVGPAMKLQEEAVERQINIYAATGFLLGRTTRDNQWELALRVMTRFVISSEDAQPEDAPSFEFERLWYQRPAWKHLTGYTRPSLLWSDVRDLPYLRGHLESFLIHVEQFKHEILSSPESEKALRHFLYGLAVETMEAVMRQRDTNDDSARKFFLDLFNTLSRLGIPRYDLFEYAIIRLPDIDMFRRYSTEFPLFLHLYDQYVMESTQDLGSSRRPSRRVLTTLIRQFGRHRSTRVIERLLSDFEKFHPEHALLPTFLLKYLVSYYSESGQVDKVHQYFDQLLEKPNPELDISLANRLHYAYARRADVLGAEQQFKRISDELHLTHDIVSWNILLLAYVRAEDLDGALACFNKILDSNLHPDIHTMGPILDLCAARGDVEAFMIFYSKAQQLKIPVRKDTRAREGWVEACLNMDDIKGAEATAQAMLEAKREGNFPGSLTHTWNLLIQHYALRGDVGASRRLYREMVENNIALDTWTYAALMRALVEVKQTNAAYKILRSTMPKNQVRVHAFHYALVISGFMRERQYRKAHQVNQVMKITRVPQTSESRLASLEVVGLAELDKLRRQNNKDPHARLVAVEESLREILLSDYKSEVAHRQPRLNKMVDFRRNVPEGYFGFLILLYGRRGAFDVCKRLFEAVAASEGSNPRWEAPIALLNAIMEAHYRAGEHEDVVKCWDLIWNQAQTLVQTLQTIMDPQQPKLQFGSLLDSSIKESFESTKIATNRRQILTRPARTYIRSLCAQQDGLQEAQQTLRNLLTSGFIVDSLTWNEFIQTLAQRGRIIDAFSACEVYLMPAFPGWRDLSPYYKRKDLQGLIWMDIRHDQVSHKTVMPRYRTLVILAAAYAQVRRDEANGVGYNPDMGGWTREILEKLSPQTLKAVETMPRTGDKLQETYLSDML